MLHGLAWNLSHATSRQRYDAIVWWMTSASLCFFGSRVSLPVGGHRSSLIPYDTREEFAVLDELLVDPKEQPSFVRYDLDGPVAHTCWLSQVRRP